MITLDSAFSLKIFAWKHVLLSTVIKRGVVMGGTGLIQPWYSSRKTTEILGPVSGFCQAILGYFGLFWAMFGRCN